MIGQPKDYNEMLKSISYSTFFVGIICTLSLGFGSPEIKNIISISPKEWDLGPVALPIIAVIIPAAITIFTRWITLHDYISDLFHIRERFDVDFILIKLAKGVGFKFDKGTRLKLKDKRYKLMRDTFYIYALNVEKAVINSQFVSEALDRWRWFWCFLEASVIILFSAFIACYFVSFAYALWYFECFLISIFLAFRTYPSCIEAAKQEVDDILNDADRRKNIFEVFSCTIK